MCIIVTLMHFLYTWTEQKCIVRQGSQERRAKGALGPGSHSLEGPILHSHTEELHYIGALFFNLALGPKSLLSIPVSQICFYKYLVSGPMKHVH